MKTPNYLSPNGTIGLVAPSFGCASNPYKACLDNAIRQFKEKGLKIILGPNCYEEKGVGISNEPRLCAEEFMQMYESTENDILLSCGGGELMCEILEYIDFDKLKSLPPKWFAGYSDNTNLTFLLTTICEVKSLYSVCAPSFGMNNWYQNHYDTLDILMGRTNIVHGYESFERESLKTAENPLAEYHLTERKELFCYDENGNKTSQLSMKGRLLGGCMDCLITLLGTRFDKVEEYLEHYREDGFLWFLESCDLNVFGMRRAMWQMEQAGWFRYIKGFIVGRPMQHGQCIMGLDQYKAILPVAERHKVPIVFDADFGHLSPAVPIICGSYGELEVHDGNFSLKMV